MKLMLTFTLAALCSGCIHYSSVQAHIYTPLEKEVLDPLHADSSVWMTKINLPTTVGEGRE